MRASSWTSRTHPWGKNYWSYNLEDNRRSLEALTQFAYEQGLTPYWVDYESFLHLEAAALPGV